MNYSSKTNNKRWVVYKHTCPNEKVYIGITCQNPYVRWLNGQGYIGNEYFYRAILKYGWDNIKHEILFTDLTKEEACEKEIELIAEYKSNNRSKGFNICKGGNLSTTGLHWKQSEETLIKRKGVKHPLYGKHHSEETKQKIRNSLIGKKLRNETIEKMKGKTPWNKGKMMAEETKEKLRQVNLGKSPTNCRKVLCVETNEIFESIMSACRNKNISCLHKALNDYSKTAGGYHWRYIESE